MNTAAIVLAAGHARRFGGGKLTALWRDRPLVAWAADAARAAGDGPVIVVLGEGADAVEAALDPAGLTLVRAPDYSLGMAHSLRAGLAALPADVDAVFVFLGDMPAIPDGMAHRLVTVLADGALAAAPVYEGMRGHPVLLRRSLFPAFTALSGDRGGGAVLNALGEALALVETTDDGVLFDIDRREDLEA